MVQQVKSELFLDVVKIFPDTRFVYKVVEGEYIPVTVAMRTNELPENIVAEIWTNLGESHHQHFRNRGLRFVKKENTVLFFNIYLKITDTGFFQIFFRARRKSDDVWRWYFKDGAPYFLDVQSDPAWVKKAIVYNAFIRFLGKKMRPSGLIKPGEGGTFDDLIKKLKHIKCLGANVIYLNPIHLIGDLFRKVNSQDMLPLYLQPGSPYSIKDYKSIDPEIAYSREHEIEALSNPAQEFKELVEKAHTAGIRVVMDLVFNHTAHDFILQRIHPEWFLYKMDIKSLEEPYIYPAEVAGGKPWGDAKHTVCPYDHGFWWEDAAQLNWEHKIPLAKNMPPPNPTKELMWDYFKSIPKYWVEQVGVDGFRCDVAYRVPVQFWKECIAETRLVAKKRKQGRMGNDVVFIAEAYSDDVFELQSAGFTAVYGDFSNKLYTPEMLKGYVDYLYNISGDFFPRNSHWFLFPECHDFHRSTKKFSEPYTKHELADLRANQSRWVLTALLPGIPMIFNGFEKLEWHPVNLFSYSAINWEGDKDISGFIRRVNKIRQSHPALEDGVYVFIPSNQGVTAQAQVFAFARVHKEETVIVVVNMDIIQRVNHAVLYLPNNIGVDFSKKYVLKDILNGSMYEREGTELGIVLEPGQSQVFTVHKMTRFLNKRDFEGGRT